MSKALLLHIMHIYNNINSCIYAFLFCQKRLVGYLEPADKFKVRVIFVYSHLLQAMCNEIYILDWIPLYGAKRPSTTNETKHSNITTK